MLECTHHVLEAKRKTACEGIPMFRLNIGFFLKITTTDGQDTGRSEIRKAIVECQTNHNVWEEVQGRGKPLDQKYINWKIRMCTSVHPGVTHGACVLFCEINTTWLEDRLLHL